METLNPSRAARRIACPGSRKMELKYPAEQNLSAEEGILAHRHAVELIPDLENITDEMEEGKKLLDETLRKHTPYYSTDLFRNHAIKINYIHENCWGVPDIFFKNFNNDFIIVDYKFGHTPVDVFHNYQLLEYAIGVFEFFRAHGSDDPKNIILIIVQPRSFGLKGKVQEWKISLDELKKYIEIIKIAELKSLEPDAPLIVSSECSHCSARHACPALQKSALDAVAIAERPDHFDLSPEELGTELRFLNRALTHLKARITGLEEQAIAKLKKGESIAYYRLMPGRGSVKWVSDIEELLAFAELSAIDIKKPQEIVTPKQAISRGMPEYLVNQYSEHVTGAVKLIEQTESDAVKIFNQK